MRRSSLNSEVVRPCSQYDQEYGIVEADIYNFDETGFAIGVATHSARVVTSSDRRGKPTHQQPGDPEWVTVIETISPTGWLLPPMVIVKGKIHLSSWYNDTDIPQNWTLALSDKGWTNDQLGYHWFTEIFDKAAVPKTIGQYRLLIIDGHGSHTTPAFDQYCKDRSIITLCMPAHSSHLLQPLDVGCFSPLKRAYSEQIMDLIKLGVHYVDKTQFLSALLPSRNKAFTAKNICSGFRPTGLVPFNPDEVLSTIQRPLTPPVPVPAVVQQLQAQTPYKLAQL
jgi:hypothetical protein